MSFRRSLSILTLALAVLVSSSFASDWPQFRGPNSAGVAVDAKIPETPRIDWAAPLPGRGLSSPIVVGEKVFVTCCSGPKQELLHLICFNAVNGSKLWERKLEATGRTMTNAKNCVASSTPCSDGQRVFAIWSCNDMAAFDFDGNLLWVRGLTVDYPNVSNSLGMASSPIVFGETVVTMIENDSESYSLGLDVHTGRNLWKLKRPKTANWTSPVSWSPDAKNPPVALLQSTQGLQAVDPASGSRLWESAGGASSMSSSVVSGGMVFTPAKGIVAFALHSNNAAPTKLWESRQMNPSTISPVVLNDRLFIINAAGIIIAADTKTGEIKWKLRASGPFTGSPVGAGARLLVVNETGLAQIVDINAPEGAVIGTLQLPLNEETKEFILCTPALSGNHIFVRTDSALWRLGE